MANPNEKIALRWFEEVWNQKRLGAVDELAHENAVYHDANSGAPASVGRAGFKEGARAVLSAIPDLHFDVADVFSADDRVAIRLVLRGTHTGEGLGVEPAGRKIAISGMAIGRFRDGKLAEGWNCFDLLSLFEQIGAVKRPG
jgi:steroid delta-isomerase-like uncharacterized protein